MVSSMFPEKGAARNALGYLMIPILLSAKVRVCRSRRSSYLNLDQVHAYRIHKFLNLDQDPSNSNSRFGSQPISFTI